MGRALGLDVGDRRIGVALSDPTGVLATPLCAVLRRSGQDAVDALVSLAREHEATAIVVGMPVSLNGGIGPQAQAVIAFCEALGSACALPIHTVNEQYTSAEAERRLRAAGVQPSRERGRVDALAAAIILQEWLDAGGPPLLATPNRFSRDGRPLHKSFPLAQGR